MSRTVVTGAAGFIGANLMRALLKEGREIKAIDSFSRGSSRSLEGLNVRVFNADLRDYRQALASVGEADTVFHLAAKVGSIDYLHGSNSAELDALQTNLLIDGNVFRACLESGVRRMVYASSVSVYPIDKQDRLGARFTEGDTRPINPEGGYGWAKLIGELQLGLMEGVKSGVARIFNAYGDFSEFGDTAQVVPALVRKAIRYPDEDFVVWGNGRQTRNPLYVADCVEALLEIEKKARSPPLVLNVGNPRTVTVKEIAETVIKASGKKIPLKFDTSKPVGPLSRIPDVALAQKELGWKPRIGLEDGVKRTYEWMSNEILAQAKISTHRRDQRN